MADSRREAQQILLRSIYPDYDAKRHSAFVERAQREVEQVVYYNWANSMGVEPKLPQVGDWAWWFVWLREHQNTLERDSLAMGRACWRQFGFTSKSDRASVDAWHQMIECANFILTVTGLEVE